MILILLAFILSAVGVLTIFRNLLYGITNGIVSIYERLFHKKRSQDWSSTKEKTKRKSRKSGKEKIFAEDEGEYVDYEKV
ncbi:MAG: DUF4834 family protein [Bacteroidaceae bacterium]|nr:DUF4834 family protein [Bacteroidaceae bacterium]